MKSANAENAAPSKKTIYCVPSVHWDREWYRPFSEFQFHLVELMDEVIGLLKEKKSIGLFHTDGYSALIEDYLEKRPEKLGDVRKFAQAGKLEIGPWYILSDMFMPSGESFIRNLEIGVKTACRYGMKKPGIPYSPDAFGHSSDVPKILSHTGFDAYYFCRGLGNQTKKPATEFVWESDDGSSVLALAGIVDVFDPPFDFSGKWFCGAYGLGMELPVKPVEFGERIDLIMHHAGRFMTSNALLMMCGSDHLLPQKHLREAIEAFNSGAGNVRCVESTLRNYVRKFKRNLGDGLEHAKGELVDGRLLMVLSGTASSRIYLKRMNFDAQNLLEGYVEPWTAFASLCGKFEYDKFLEDVWKLVLKNQAHDSICGCSVDPVHLEMEQRYREIFQVSEKLFQKAARLCMGDIDQRMIFQDGYPDEFKIGVFSAVPWRENRPFELEIIHPAEINLADYTLADADNREIRFEIEHTSQAVSTTGPFVPPSADNKLLAVTKAIADSANLPAYGYKLLKFKKKKNIVPERGGNTFLGFPTLKNEHLTVKIGRDGQLLVESADGAFGKIFRGLLCFEDEADAGDEYLFTPVEGDVPVNSSACEARVNWLIKSDFVQQVEIRLSLECPAFYDEKNKARSRKKTVLNIRNILTLTNGSRRIDVVSEIENSCADHRMKVCFKMPWQVNDYLVQTQFGAISHSIVLPENSDNWREKPTSTRRNFGWIAVEDENTGTGFAVLPKGLYEHAMEKNVLKMTLLRSVGILGKSAGPNIPTPDAQCRSLQRCEYALVFFDDRSADENYLWREFQSYARPPKAVMCSAGCHGVPAERSFLELESEELVLSSVVKGYMWGELKTRIYNISGEKSSGVIKSSGGLRKTDARRNKNSRLAGATRQNLNLKPKEILSFLIPKS